MITIEENDKYALNVDIGKNQAYLKVKGFWRGPEEVPNYLEDWEKATSKLRSGFTLLTDATDMKIHPGNVRDIHKKAQQHIITKGVWKVAELQNEKISVVQLDGVSRESGMPKKSFNDREAALQWLAE